jgi:hypothetical protein
MNRFGVLTNRKRAIIALVHSIVFLGIAIQGCVSPKAGILHGAGATADYILISIYVVVATILLWLVTMSCGLVERVYFALCVTSASSGLVRTVIGDQMVPAAQYLRVLMLSSAVVVGIFIVRAHSRPARSDAMTPLPSEASQD